MFSVRIQIGTTALHRAVSVGLVWSVELFLSRGAAVDACDEVGVNSAGWLSRVVSLHEWVSESNQDVNICAMYGPTQLIIRTHRDLWTFWMVNKTCLPCGIRHMHFGTQAHGRESS